MTTGAPFISLLFTRRLTLYLSKLGSTLGSLSPGRARASSSLGRNSSERTNTSSLTCSRYSTTPWCFLYFSRSSFIKGLTTYWTTSLSSAFILSFVSFSTVLASRIASLSLSCRNLLSSSMRAFSCFESFSKSSWPKALPSFAGTTARPLTVFLRIKPFSCAFCSNL